MKSAASLGVALEDLTAKLVACGMDDVCRLESLRSEIADVLGQLEPTGAAVAAMQEVLHGLAMATQDAAGRGESLLNASATVLDACSRALAGSGAAQSSDLDQAVQSLRALREGSPARSGQTQTNEDAASGGQGSIAMDESPRTLSGEVDAELLSEFITESLGHISSARGCLRRLKQCPGDDESLKTALRAFHTIKGSAGFLDLRAVRRLAHAAEALLADVRDGHLVMAGSLAEADLLACDMLELALHSLEGLSAGEVIPAVKNLSELTTLLEESRIVGQRSLTENVSLSSPRHSDDVGARVHGPGARGGTAA